MRPIKLLSAIALIVAITLPTLAALDTQSADDFAKRDRGEGPFQSLILHKAFLIDGRGGPTRGPMDVHIEGDKITKIIPSRGAPAADAAVKVINLEGHYLLPGFVNAHGHLHSVASGAKGWGPEVPAEYIAKLWLAHGITSVREVGNGRGAKWLKEVADRARDGDITAPDIYPYLMFYQRALGTYVATPEGARRVVSQAKKDGMVGIKFIGAPRRLLVAALDEAAKQGLKTTMHHAQTSVVASNVLTTSEAGLDAMEHWYGLPEALFYDRIVQDYSPDYVYENEQDRFGEAGQLWRQAAPKGHPRYEQVMKTLLERDFHMTPTFSIYLANRDWMRARNADWHAHYTLPYLWDWFRPSNTAHGSYWYDWTQDRELAWQENFRLWMSFINDYKNRGGLIAAGEDAGYIYSTYGFGYIQELELLHEAGFHPLEVIQSATLQGARLLGLEEEFGTVEVGKAADIIVARENPLQNLKTLYASGHLRMNRETGITQRIGGIRYTIKDGILYDVDTLKADIRKMVNDSKKERGLSPGPMPIENDTTP